VVFQLQAKTPEAFRNCVDVHVEVKLIRKMHVCKVCGFSVPVPVADPRDDPAAQRPGPEAELLEHVMGHSLKELYETGYDVTDA